MNECFPRRLGGNVKVELDLYKYTTKADFKKVTGVDTSKPAKKIDLASLKSETDKLDIGKLETTPADFEKLNDVGDKKLLKKRCVINWFKNLMLFRLLILAV